MIEDDFPLLPGALPFLGGVEAWQAYVAAQARLMKRRPDLFPWVMLELSRKADRNYVSIAGGADTFGARPTEPYDIPLNSGASKVSVKLLDGDRRLIREVREAFNECRARAISRIRAGEIALLVRRAAFSNDGWRELAPDELAYVRSVGDQHLWYVVAPGRQRVELRYRMREVRGSPAAMSPLLYCNEAHTAALRRLIDLRPDLVNRQDLRALPSRIPALEAVRERVGAAKDFYELVEDCRRLPGYHGAPSGRVDDYLLERLRRCEVIARGKFGIFPPGAWADVRGPLVDRYIELCGFGGMRFDSIEDFYGVLADNDRLEAEFGALRFRRGHELVAKLRRGVLIASSSNGVVAAGAWKMTNGDEFLAECETDMLIRSASSSEMAAIQSDEPTESETKSKLGRPVIDHNIPLFREVLRYESEGMPFEEARDKIVDRIKSKSPDLESRRKLIKNGVDRERRKMREVGGFEPEKKI